MAVDGKDLTKEIRNHHVSTEAALFAKIPSVRKYLASFQRQLPGKRPVVMEGRDIGTVIFPDAFCKFFLTASPKTRAQRRLLQLRELGRAEPTLEELMEDQNKRDTNDSTREDSPLKKAPDAITMETDGLTTKATVQLMLEHIREKARRINLSL